MAHLLDDRVKETTTTTGTGTLTLAGAVTGFKAFSAVMAVNDTTYYAIVDNATGAWETGVGTLASATTLARTTVLESSNADAFTNFTSGTKDVFITLPGAKALPVQPDNSVLLPAITTEPAVPPASRLAVYAKAYAGRLVPKVKGPSGLDYALQASFWGNNITMWSSTNATAGLWIGTTGLGAGGFTNRLPTLTNLYTTMKRGSYASVATTLNQVLGQRNVDLMYFRGSAVNQGGFFFFTRCGMDTWTNGGRFFAGLATSSTVVSADPSALNNTVGFCIDAADNGAISFLTRGTAATKAATGFSMATNAGFDLYMFCPPNGTDISWRIVNINTGAEASGTATLNLPTNTVMLNACVLASNAALTAATAVSVGLNRIYVETDY